jgi:hypothetical protein
VVDAAIAHAVASLRDVADRLETGPRQRSAEVLMRGSAAIEELTRQADLLLSDVSGGHGWFRWLRRRHTSPNA